MPWSTHFKRRRCILVLWLPFERFFWTGDILWNSAHEAAHGISLHRVGRPESRLMGVFRRFVRRRIARDMGRMLVSSKCFLIALEEPIAVVDALERLLLDLAMVLLQLLLSLLPRGVVVVWNMFRKSSRLPEAKEHPSSQNSWPTSLGISAEDVARRSPFCILLLDCLRVLDLVTVIDILVTELVNACLHCSRRFEGGIRI
mmetsp:Transcript_93290/g.221850  ORF Transcript_93290/g.221850 Transcript_93290/m.221850 type:complete len:201 (-) Transcript_93290:378-980(-)